MDNPAGSSSSPHHNHNHNQSSSSDLVNNSNLNNIRSSVEENAAVQMQIPQDFDFDEFIKIPVSIDESPLKPKLNQNKESLKIKLQMRRPINQLVEQGILPAPNTPPAFACQRVKLERARMGDLLKAKIQQRPSRQELVRQHILEETDPRVAPLLAEKQRMLKRARLADSLNDHLIHRPGPLELVKKNILHAPDESIEKAIKDGIVPFKATCEGATPGPPLPTKYITQEDDSSSDVSSPILVDSESGSPPEVKPSVVPPIPPPLPPLPLQPTAQNIISQNNIIQITQSPQQLMPPLPQLTQQQQQNIFTTSTPLLFTTQQQQQPIQTQSSSSSSNLQQYTSIKNRAKKISKPKSQSKPKTIKFHEYKGPPNSQLNKSDANFRRKSAESSYELLLQQQQLFLQWQLEWQHRFPKILLPAVSKMTAEDKKAFSITLPSTPLTPLAPAPPNSQTQQIQPQSITTINSHIPNSPKQESSSSNHSDLLILATINNSTTTTSNTTNTIITSNNIINPTEKSTDQGIITQKKLNDWKVNELKAELKKRNLPVSGSKSQLLDRLISHIQADTVYENNKPVLPIQNSRSVLQQKIQLKLQQQQAKVETEKAGWVLKIQESPQQQPVTNNTTTSFQKSFENCLADLLADEQSQPPVPVSTPVNNKEKDDHIKSQMVDDVLEILIRNGELPATAATPTPSISSTVAQNQSTPTITTNYIMFIPPPAPPLPPSTFAITLPTEITFRKNLTKEEEILKISQELANFGHHQNSSDLTQQQQITPRVEAHSNNNVSMDCHDPITTQNTDLTSNNITSSQHQNHLPINSIDDLLLKLDNDFPMDTEYSDWLEHFNQEDNNRLILHPSTTTNTNSNQDEQNNVFDPLLSSINPPLTNSHTHNNTSTTTTLNPNLMMDTTEDDETEPFKRKNNNDNNDPSNLQFHQELWDFSF